MSPPILRLLYGVRETIKNTWQTHTNNLLSGVRVAKNLISHFLSSYGHVKILILTSNGFYWAQGHRWNEISKERIACPQTREKCPLCTMSQPPPHLLKWFLKSSLITAEKHTHFHDRRSSSLIARIPSQVQIGCRILYEDSKRGVTLTQSLQIEHKSLGQNSRWEYSSMYRVLTAWRGKEKEIEKEKL